MHRASQQADLWLGQADRMRGDYLVRSRAALWRRRKISSRRPDEVRCLRMLDTTTLALGHVPKSMAVGQRHSDRYGSVFHQNYARSVSRFRNDKKSARMGPFRLHTSESISAVCTIPSVRMFQYAESTEIRYSCD